MEEAYLRFPHLIEQILAKLNNQKLTKCRLINKLWKNMIDNQKEPLIRKIQVRTNFSYKSVIRILSKNNLKKIYDVAKQVQKI